MKREIALFVEKTFAFPQKREGATRVLHIQATGAIIAKTQGKLAGTVPMEQGDSKFGRETNRSQTTQAPPDRGGREFLSGPLGTHKWTLPDEQHALTHTGDHWGGYNTESG